MDRRKLWIGLALLLIAAGVWWISTDPSMPAETAPAAVATVPPTPVPDVRAPGRRVKSLVVAEAEPEVDAPAAPAELQPIRFVVKAIDGPPLAGATLEVTPESGDAMTIVTDADGKATTPRPTDWRMMKVVARAPGFVASRWRPGALEYEADAGFLVLLFPGVRLTGRVVDEATGAAIADARVESRNSFGFATAETRTDTSGDFTLDAVEKPCNVLCRAPGRASLWTKSVDAAATPLVIAVPRGGRVHGVVRDAEGRPAAGARVTAMAAPAYETQPAYDETVTDVDGRYSIEGLWLDAPYSLTASLNGFSEVQLGRVVIAADVPVVERDVGFAPFATLTVKTLGVDGRPARDVEIAVLEDAQDSESRRWRKSENGVSTFRVDAGVVFAAARLGDAASAHASAELAAGEERTLELRLSPGGVVAGVVVDDAGAPVPRAHVKASWTLVSMSGSSSFTTYRTGGFRLEIPVREPCRLTATARGHVDGSAEATPGGDAAMIRMVRHARLRFRMRWPAGTGLHSGWAWSLLDDAGGRTAGEWSSSDDDKASAVERDVDAAATRLRIDAGGFARFERELRLTPGTKTDLGEIALDAGATLRGRAVDGAGRPVRVTRVQVYADAGHGDLLTAGLPQDDGPFEVRGLPRTRVFVRVEAKGFADEETTVEASTLDEPLAVVLRRGALLRVRVDLPSGRAAENPTLVLVAADGTKTALGYECVRPGVYETRVPVFRGKLTTELDGLRAEADVDLVEGATRDVVLRLAR